MLTAVASPLSRFAPGAPVVVSRETSAEDWDRYVSGHAEATVDHLWCWREIFERVFGHECAYLVARRGATVVGVLPLVLFHSRLFGRFAVSVPFLNYGGLLTDDAESAAALVEQAKQIAISFRASHVELRHQTRMCPDLPYRQHKLALKRTLPSTVEELWKDTDRKVRNQVRKGQKENLEPVAGGLELVDEFYAVFTENMRDLGTPVYSKRLFTDTLRLLPDRARVFVVRHAGRPIAGGVSIRFGETVLVPWASSLREFRHLCSNMLLYWTMLESAVTAGARVFDFGRSSPGGGTHQFKLQWGAEETPLYWEYILLSREAAPDHGPTNPKFKMAIDAWKRLPLWLTNQVGPVIAKHLP